MPSVAANTGQARYNNPIGGVKSNIGNQLSDFYYQKKALIDAAKEQYFMQLADVTAMPKNMGKTIKRYHYIPLLDDANINDQGIDAAGVASVGGNLYGSSKDVGTIQGKLPLVSEVGGRVNRVGFKRKELEGTIQKMGFFDEYTQESLDFDSDAELRMHINRAMVDGASQLTEAVLQIDLLNSAGIVRFGGTAATTGDMNSTSKITYGDLMRLSIDLDNNRTPKQTKVIAGTRYIDTRTIGAARAMYVGSELLPMLTGMKNQHNQPAFIPVHQYAAGTNVMRGEVGSIDHFRIIVVPEMLKWAGAGAAENVGDTEEHYVTDSKYDVFPMLVVGSESFTTIGFQTDGKTVKFKITHEAPGKADRSDPYGESGFMSIKWYYGFMALRPERIAVCKTTAIL